MQRPCPGPRGMGTWRPQAGSEKFGGDGLEEIAVDKDVAESLMTRTS